MKPTQSSLCVTIRGRSPPARVCLDARICLLSRVSFGLELVVFGSGLGRPVSRQRRLKDYDYALDLERHLRHRGPGRVSGSGTVQLRQATSRAGTAGARSPEECTSTPGVGTMPARIRQPLAERALAGSLLRRPPFQSGTGRSMRGQCAPDLRRRDISPAVSTALARHPAADRPPERHGTQHARAVRT
jgi:hypothetical protein